MQVIDFEDMGQPAHHQGATARVAFLALQIGEQLFTRHGPAAREHVGDTVKREQCHGIEIHLVDRLVADQGDESLGQGAVELGIKQVGRVGIHGRRLLSGTPLLHSSPPS